MKWKVFLIIFLIISLLGAGAYLTIDKGFAIVLLSQFDFEKTLQLEEKVTNDNPEEDTKDKLPIGAINPSSGTSKTGLANPAASSAGGSSAGTMASSSKASDRKASSESQVFNYSWQAFKELPGSGQSNSREMSSRNSSKAAISIEKIGELEEKVSLADKATAMSIVLSHLSPSDFTAFREMAKGGISSGEIEMAKSMLKGKVTESDKAQLSQLLSKYEGLLK